MSRKAQVFGGIVKEKTEQVSSHYRETSPKQARLQKSLTKVKSAVSVKVDLSDIEAHVNGGGEAHAEAAVAAAYEE